MQSDLAIVDVLDMCVAGKFLGSGVDWLADRIGQFEHVFADDYSLLACCERHERQDSSDPARQRRPKKDDEVALQQCIKIAKEHTIPSINELGVRGMVIYAIVDKS
jgi:hypothetical protein